MKKILFSLLAVLLVLPIGVNAKEKVKVYMFEAGGCPYCEAQMKYLKGLEGYNKEFEVIQKEAYIDHVEWKQGKDYDLAVKVSEAFMNKGFQNATYNATPFVIISNIYASAAYNTGLESVIKEAYEKGDEDIVKCIEDGKKDCTDKIPQQEGTTPSTDTTTDTTAKTSVDKEGNIIAVTLISAVIMTAVYLVKSTLDTNKIIEAVNSKRK